MPASDAPRARRTTRAATKKTAKTAASARATKATKAGRSTASKGSASRTAARATAGRPATEPVVSTPVRPTVTARKADATDARVDVVVVGVVPGSGGSGSGGSGSSGSGSSGSGSGGGEPVLAPGAEAVAAAYDGSLIETLRALGATGKVEELTVVPSAGATRAPVIAAVGLGSGDGDTSESLRRAAGSVVRRFDGRASSLAYALELSDPASAAAIVEGSLLGAYAFDTYRSKPATGTRPSSILLACEASPSRAVKDAVAGAESIADAVNLARAWVDMPPSDLYPEVFADAIRSEARRDRLACDVLDVPALESGGYGGILGVGQGSTRGPRLVRLSYAPANAKRSIALVGKGITFDSGGLSLKPNEGMKTMKCDMAGAATVVAAVLAIARLELPVAVTAWACLAENMPSGSAQRPSDVLRIHGGTTVEVLNTDAEGRLVLADGLVRACEDEPDAVLDVATLTGAAVMALGERTYAVMGNDDGLRAAVCDAAERAGEPAWPLPIPDETRGRLDSKVADLANVSAGRYGGALVAAAFLREFVTDGTRWAHLDIAGPAFNGGGPFGYTPTGATGTGVRTLVEVARAAAAGKL